MPGIICFKSLGYWSIIVAVHVTFYDNSAMRVQNETNDFNKSLVFDITLSYRELILYTYRYDILILYSCTSP